MAEHHNARASQLLGQLKDFLARAADARPLPPPFGPPSERADVSAARGDIPGLYAPVSQALGDSIALHGSVWPEVATANLARLFERIQSGEGWSPDPQTEQVRVQFLRGWFEAIKAQVECYQHLRHAFGFGPKEAVGFAAETIARLRNDHATLFLEKQDTEEASAFITALFKIYPHLDLIQSRYSTSLDEMGNQEGGGVKRCLVRIVKATIDLDLELVQFNPQLADWRRLEKLAKVLENDTGALEMMLQMNAWAESRGLGAEEEHQIGRRAARRYRIDRRALTRENVWSKFV